MSIFEQRLNDLITNHHPQLWGDIRRYAESEVMTEAKLIYLKNKWPKPQHNDYGGVRSDAVRLSLPTITKAIPDALKLTDQMICEQAKAEAERYCSSEGATERERDPAWHRRKLRRQARQEVATWLYKAGATKEYTTNFSRKLSAAAQKRNDEILSRRYIIIPETGEKVYLDEIAAKGATNLHNENIALSSDMIKVAMNRGWYPHFITLTCAGYRREYTPDINHDFLQIQWARMRAKLNKHGLKAGYDFIGLRSEEPHKDQTPHRHLVLFCGQEEWEIIESEFKHYFLTSDRPDERGAKRYRIEIDDRSDGDWKKAINYSLKYTMKNTSKDNASQFEDSNNTAASCKAWRQDWGIRAFQFFGCGTKTVFRYCRSRSYSADIDMPIVKAAQSGDWATFIEEFYRLKGSIKAIKKEYENKYRETVKKVIGYKLDGVTFVKKVFDWTIHEEPRKSAEVTLILTVPRGENLSNNNGNNIQMSGSPP